MADSPIRRQTVLDALLSMEQDPVEPTVGPKRTPREIEAELAGRKLVRDAAQAAVQPPSQAASAPKTAVEAEAKATPAASTTAPFEPIPGYPYIPKGMEVGKVTPEQQEAAFKKAVESLQFEKPSGSNLNRTFQGIRGLVTGDPVLLAEAMGLEGVREQSENIPVLGSIYKNLISTTGGIQVVRDWPFELMEFVAGTVPTSETFKEIERTFKDTPAIAKPAEFLSKISPSTATLKDIAMTEPTTPAGFKELTEEDLKAEMKKFQDAASAVTKEPFALHITSFEGKYGIDANQAYMDIARGLKRRMIIENPQRLQDPEERIIAEKEILDEAKRTVMREMQNSRAPFFWSDDEAFDKLKAATDYPILRQMIHPTLAILMPKNKTYQNGAITESTFGPKGAGQVLDYALNNIIAPGYYANAWVGEESLLRAPWSDEALRDLRAGRTLMDRSEEFGLRGEQFALDMGVAPDKAKKIGTGVGVASLILSFGLELMSPSFAGKAAKIKGAAKTATEFAEAWAKRGAKVDEILAKAIELAPDLDPAAALKAGEGIFGTVEKTIHGEKSGWMSQLAANAIESRLNGMPAFREMREAGEIPMVTKASSTGAGWGRLIKIEDTLRALAKDEKDPALAKKAKDVLQQIPVEIAEVASDFKSEFAAVRGNIARSAQRADAPVNYAALKTNEPIAKVLSEIYGQDTLDNIKKTPGNLSTILKQLGDKPGNSVPESVRQRLMNAVHTFWREDAWSDAPLSRQAMLQLTNPQNVTDSAEWMDRAILRAYGAFDQLIRSPGKQKTGQISDIANDVIRIARSRSRAKLQALSTFVEDALSKAHSAAAGQKLPPEKVTEVMQEALYKSGEYGKAIKTIQRNIDDYVASKISEAMRRGTFQARVQELISKAPNVFDEEKATAKVTEQLTRKAKQEIASNPDVVVGLHNFALAHLPRGDKLFAAKDERERAIRSFIEYVGKAAVNTPAELESAMGKQLRALFGGTNTGPRAFNLLAQNAVAVNVIDDVIRGQAATAGLVISPEVYEGVWNVFSKASAFMDKSLLDDVYRAMNRAGIPLNQQAVQTATGNELSTAFAQYGGVFVPSRVLNEMLRVTDSVNVDIAKFSSDVKIPAADVVKNGLTMLNQLNRRAMLAGIGPGIGRTYYTNQAADIFTGTLIYDGIKDAIKIVGKSVIFNTPLLRTKLPWLNRTPLDMIEAKAASNKGILGRLMHSLADPVTSAVMRLDENVKFLDKNGNEINAKDFGLLCQSSELLSGYALEEFVGLFENPALKSSKMWEWLKRWGTGREYAEHADFVTARARVQYAVDRMVNHGDDQLAAIKRAREAQLDFGAPTILGDSLLVGLLVPFQRAIEQGIRFQMRVFAEGISEGVKNPDITWAEAIKKAWGPTWHSGFTNPSMFERQRRIYQAIQASREAGQLAAPAAVYPEEELTQEEKKQWLAARLSPDFAWNQLGYVDVNDEGKGTFVGMGRVSQLQDFGMLLSIPAGLTTLSYAALTDSEADVVATVDAMMAPWLDAFGPGASTLVDPVRQYYTGEMKTFDNKSRGGMRLRPEELPLALQATTALQQMGIAVTTPQLDDSTGDYYADPWFITAMRLMPSITKTYTNAMATNMQKVPNETGVKAWAYSLGGLTSLLRFYEVDPTRTARAYSREIQRDLRDAARAGELDAEKVKDLMKE